MVDIHSHILPFVDDGADSIFEAMEMLRIASYSGTRSIVLTPHTYLFDDSMNEPEYIAVVFDAFKQKLDKEGIDIDIYLGGEVFCNDKTLTLVKQHKIPTINKSRFVLVEFDFFASIDYICDSLRVFSSLGYVPIVAHPERYECLKHGYKAGLDIMNSGALLQINKGSIFGDFGVGARSCANELMQHKMAHFVASDAHSSHGRNPDMELAYDIVKDELGEKSANSLFDVNPSAILTNSKLVISRPIL